MIGEVIANTNVIRYLMAAMGILGVIAKLVNQVTLNRLIRAAGTMSKSTHRLIKLVKAKYDHTCMVEVARFFMNFTQNESCGKCVPCREGTKRMLEILERIVAGNGKLEDLDLLEELANMITETALCGLGKSAALPVMSTLKVFHDEYVEHVVEKKCASHTCTALRKFIISPERCKGCSKCARNCPVGAISGKIKEPFTIDTEKCIKCGACASACAFGAIHIEG